MTQPATTTVLNDEDIDSVRVLRRRDNPSATLPWDDDIEHVSTSTKASSFSSVGFSGYLAFVAGGTSTALRIEHLGSPAEAVSRVASLMAKGIPEEMTLTTLFAPFARLEARRVALTEEVWTVFFRAGAEAFEDGMESLFAKELKSLIERHGRDALELIGALVEDSRADPAVIGEALRWLGLVKYRASHEDRLAVLVRALGATSAQIRDGALLGLSFLNDPRAIIPLETAASHEKKAVLRRFMREVIAQLQKST